MRKNTMRRISLAVVLVLCLSTITVPAEARASEYIDSYSAYATASGNGRVKISFDITGTKTMAEIGATKIEIKSSSGTTLKTFKYTDSGYSSMMGYNRISYSSNITYQGVAGNTYYAVVYYKAANSAGGDTDFLATYTVKAT